MKKVIEDKKYIYYKISNLDLNLTKFIFRNENVTPTHFFLSKYKLMVEKHSRKIGIIMYDHIKNNAPFYINKGLVENGMFISEIKANKNTKTKNIMHTTF